MGGRGTISSKSKAKSEVESKINSSARQENIKKYFEKIKLDEQNEILSYLGKNALKEYRGETKNLYINKFEKNSNKYLIVDNFKALSFEDKAKIFKYLKNDYLTQMSFKENKTWHS